MSSTVKSKATKCQNISVAEDEFQSILANGWMPSYNQRALLCRILYNSGDKQKQSDIQKVKLVTKEKGEETYSCTHDIISNINNFYAILDENLETFDNSFIENDQWNKIVDFINFSQFKYENIDGIKQWTTVTPDMGNAEFAKKLDQLSLDSQFYMSAFTAALKCDMKNGQAKHWMNLLIKTLLTCLKTSDGLVEDDVKLNFWAPAHHCNTNTTIEMVCRDIKNSISEVAFNSPYSSDSSTEVDVDLSSSSLESPCMSDCGDKRMSRQITVPDFCVALRYFPGMFPLVVDLKPAGLETQGFNQNIKQMLSKLFYQDVVFGLVVSTRQYQLSTVFKNEGSLHFLSLTPVSIYAYRNKMFSLDLQALHNMCSFMYRVLKWSLKSKCLLNA